MGRFLQVTGLPNLKVKTVPILICTSAKDLARPCEHVDRDVFVQQDKQNVMCCVGPG